VDSSNDQSEEFDVTCRDLCADGNCTGLLGADRCCKVCGLPEDGIAAASTAPTGSSDPSEHFDDDRELCSDGNCTGLLDADGRCKLCGKSS